MAASHKKLASGQLGVAGTPAAIYTATGVTGMVKTVILHNMNSTTETAEIFFDGTADSTRMLNVSIDAGDTFEWTLGHMVVVADTEILKGQSTTVNKVNYFIFGAEE